VMVAPGLTRGGLDGSLLALGSAGGFALFSVALRRGRAADATPAVLHAALFSAVVAALLVLAADGLAGLAITPRDLLLCAAMGVGQIGCGMLAFTAGSRHLPAAELGLLALSEVVLAPFWAWLVLSEVPAAATLAGGGLVLAAAAAQAFLGAARPGTPPHPQAGHRL
jgi:drug/metabolite transporter, DME family